MPEITLQFPRNSYPSLQVADVAYYSVPTVTPPTENFTINNPTFNDGPFDQGLVLAGPITFIDQTTSLADGTLTTSITIDLQPDVPEPDSSNFVFFEKSKTANISSLVGYYARIKFYNNSSNRAEMFSASCEISESSK
jgi:hypothetical protein